MAQRNSNISGMTVPERPRFPFAMAAGLPSDGRERPGDFRINCSLYAICRKRRDSARVEPAGLASDGGELAAPGPGADGVGSDQDRVGLREGARRRSSGGRWIWECGISIRWDRVRGRKRWTTRRFARDCGACGCHLVDRNEFHDSGGMEADLETQLRRLGTDYVDVWLLQAVDRWNS